MAARLTRPERAKRELRKLLYPHGKIKRGGLTCAGRALDVLPGTVRQWAVGHWMPSEQMAERILWWIGQKPRIVDGTGYRVAAK